ncbi:uncharacterized protein LOC106721436 [Papilio machaon]|uniref:uncharacterized protein LOC106721436 n=1 Tax=Papilio machaon TaxID=76193 RepID=UPI001E665739|nr:uncharacterized protein LOC106721436 [Papilio machaon]
MEEISLLIRGEEFIVKKEVLCEYSDYFKAMFSGNYIEKEKSQIIIDVLPPNIMQIILQYMNIGLIDLSDYSHQIIGEIAMAANFLQISELIKQIEYTLDIQLSVNNWIDTMTIAENASYIKLEEHAVAFGLFSFKLMKPSFISSIKKLFWYLSHPYLDAECELDVFKFGLDWVLNNETGADAIMIVLGSLDLSRLSLSDFLEMKSLTTDYNSSLPAKVIDGLVSLHKKYGELSPQIISEQKELQCETFTRRVYDEICNLVKESKHRKLKFTLSLPMTIKQPLADESPHYMYTYTLGVGFGKWLELVEKNLWGWNVVSYNGTKLVIVCGEYGKGTGMFMRDVKEYDTLRREWNRHGVQLPQRRHGSVAVLGDSLYIIGGVGGFRVVLDTAIIYNMREKTFRSIAKLPDAIQNPAICCHNNYIYTAGHKHIYRHVESDDKDQWELVATVSFRVKCMVSHKGYIYCTQSYFNELYRFRPFVDNELQPLTGFYNIPTVLCNLGGRLLAFTENNKLFKHTDVLSLEEYTDNAEFPEVLYTQTDAPMTVNETAGYCALVMETPPLCKSVSTYHLQYLTKYPD